MPCGTPELVGDAPHREATAAAAASRRAARDRPRRLRNVRLPSPGGRGDPNSAWVFGRPQRAAPTTACPLPIAYCPLPTAPSEPGPLRQRLVENEESPEVPGLDFEAEDVGAMQGGVPAGSGVGRLGRVRLVDAADGRQRLQVQDLLYLRALKPRAAACPPGWVANCAALMQNRLPYLRAQTLAHLPRPVPEPLVRLLPNLMLDPDAAVQNQAFLVADALVAQGTKIPAHRDIALKVLSTTTDYWLLGASSGLALKYGASYECAAIWAKRFDEPTPENWPSMPHEAVQALWGIVTGGHISGGFRQAPDARTAQDLKPRWVAFIEAHRDDIRAGHHFAPGDGILPKDLLPEGWEYYPPKQR